ncbi:MAG: hypothetical protein DMG04_23230 [Acidobacteria bacterium]|nr:MAG: hypothetical protein AUI11_01755 [Acidobacteria bacterium 13_2_20CM_2_66_4]PYQ70860.1 MAG: hypothetical protein DMG04_23230 [Acidobacteriota bacterium]PYQ73475.1 MAG: hypothetical protein DMG01_22525 [Acidobacteriota bacterium]PYQ85061.1 MAG: hypothetical protein DMG03_09680 [Acidobacteriota bacterium]PYQ90941.1 MAG: hypothetical protein DMG02_09275 [Acidobacteriota bacterium]
MGTARAAALILLVSSFVSNPSAQRAGRASADRDLPISMRPATLGDQIDTLAGRSVRLPYSRVVGVLDPRVFVIDSQTKLPPVVGNRSRVLVFIDTGSLRVEPAVLVGSTITVSGIARTLLGMQMGREVSWPPALTREAVEHLEIRAAVLAKSVTTVEGIDLVQSLRQTPTR